MVVVVGLEYSYVAGHAVSPRRNEAKKIFTRVKMNMIHNIVVVTPGVQALFSNNVRREGQQPKTGILDSEPRGPCP